MTTPGRFSSSPAPRHPRASRLGGLCRHRHCRCRLIIRDSGLRCGTGPLSLCSLGLGFAISSNQLTYGHCSGRSSNIRCPVQDRESFAGRQALIRLKLDGPRNTWAIHKSVNVSIAADFQRGRRCGHGVQKYYRLLDNRHSEAQISF